MLCRPHQQNITLDFGYVFDNNNNNNNNNNDNNKDLFALSIFTMTLRAIEKNYKNKKNVKTHQYITANIKNMTTKIVKGL